MNAMLQQIHPDAIRRESDLFDTFILVRSGFLQHQGSAGAGWVLLGRSLAWRFGSNRCRVELVPWNDNPEHRAEFIYRWGVSHRAPRVIDISYSWGVGYGFVQTSRALGRRGIDVEAALLCDGVHHSPALWRALIPGTLLRRFSIRVPANVKSVMGFRQTLTTPRGHDWTFASPYTRCLGPSVFSDVGHTEIDNDSRVHVAAISLCQQLIEEGKTWQTLEFAA